MNETIYKALCACLGLSPDSTQALSLIRQAYTEPENSPQPPRSADVIYWSMWPEQGSDPPSYEMLVEGFPARSLNRRGSTLWRPLVSADLTADKISATGGRQRFAPQTTFGHKPTVHRYLPYQLLVVCYGPGCEAYARKIRAFLYIDGVNLPRGILRKAGIYPVPEPAAIQLFYEPEGSLWRRRADLTISLRIRDDLVYSTGRGAITSPPAVIIH